MERRTLGDGRYELLDPIGQGGMATVWRAFDTRLGVERAIKILQPPPISSTRSPQTARERFQREARLMAQLEHPHIVPIHDAGIERDQIYMVMSLLRGGSIAEHLERRGALAPRQAVSVVEGVLKALATAHAQGVIHRDIKPQNVLVDDQGHPRLTDFGIARVLREDGQLTRTGATMGTYAFMAPEQRSNARDADARSDLYAVGALMVALLTAQLPYDLHHPEAFASQVERLPVPLRPFVDRCVRFAPEERWSSATEALAALQAAASALDPDPAGTPPLRPFLRSADPESTLYTDSHTASSPEEGLPSTATTPPRARWWWLALLGTGTGAAMLSAAALLAAGAALSVLLVNGSPWEPAPDAPAPDTPAPAQDPPAPAPEPTPKPPAPAEPAPPGPAAPVPAAPAPAAPAPAAPAPAAPASQRRPEDSRPQPEPVPSLPTLVVRVAADPSAVLEIDGQAVGVTPWSGPLSLGAHTLVFRDEQGSMRLRRPITVVEGGKLEYCWVLSTEEPCSR